MSDPNSPTSNAFSRPPDLNVHFWDMLLLLAREPAFHGLRDSLAGDNTHRSAPDEEAEAPASQSTATTLDEHDPEEPLEAGRGADASPRRTRIAGTAPYAGEAGGSRPCTGESQAYNGSRLHPGVFSPMQALRLVERLGHPRIWRAYHTGLFLFISFRENLGLPSTWPIPGNQIRRFLRSLDLQDASSPEIFMYLAGLSYISRMFNFQDPFQDLFTVRMMKGMRWQREPPIPLSVETLESLMGVLEDVCETSYDCLLYRAVFSLSFFGALRPKEIVAECCSTQRPELLCLNDVEIQQDTIGINLRSAEMGQGTFIIRLQQLEPWLCPGLALQNYLAVRPRGEGPLFVYSSGHVLIREQFLVIFRAALRRLDLPSEHYSIRSFWLGSLIYAVRCHFPERAILCLARWPCRAFLGGYGEL